MKDQIGMSKANGELMVVIPLFRSHYTEKLLDLDEYSVQMQAFTNRPIAYVLEHPEFGFQLFNADFVHANVEFLGDL